MSTRADCDIIHILTTTAICNIGHYVTRLETERDSNWSPATLQMMHLVSDTVELESLARRIAELRKSMIRYTKEVA